MMKLQRPLASANYFTILFSFLGLFFSPSVINAQCSINTTVNVGGCFDSNGNTAGGVNQATVQVIVDWQNRPGTENIILKLQGQVNVTIDPDLVSKPYIYNYTLTADGTSKTVDANFSTTTSCQSTQKTATLPVGNCLLEPCAVGNTGGIVWRDFNNDGIKDATETEAIAGVIVKAYDKNGALVETNTTDYLGQYTFTTLTPSATNKYRFEFSNIPPPYQPTFKGTNGKTDIQFVAAASCTVHLGLNNPADYCQTNPGLVTACYINGNLTSTVTTDAFVKWSYNNTGIAALDKTAIARKNQIGSTWGIAYDKQRKKIYTSAFLKRHVAMGPSGLGAIYTMNTDGTSLSLLIDVDALLPGTNSLGAIASNTTRALGAETIATNDASVFDQIYKVGLGGLEISEDNQTLYTVDLNNRQIVAINLADNTLLATYAIPNPNCVGGTYRPFALKYKNGKLYVGVVCDAQTSGNAANLTATIYELNGSMFTSVLSFPLNYVKGFTQNWGQPCTNFPGWYAWRSTIPPTCESYPPSTNFGVSYPTPILAGIDFDIDGSMIMAFNDRMGHQLANGGYGLTGTTNTYYNISGGDIIRADYQLNGGFILERNGSVGSLTSSAGVGNTQGLGGGEFYAGENLTQLSTNIVRHAENVYGGLRVLPGKNEVAVICYDPIDWPSAGADYDYISVGGVEKLSNTTGARNNGFRIYSTFDGSGNDGTLSKATGLGDLEVLCNPQPIQVGNYVWYDQNKNGVQEPSEQALSGIVVSLWKGVTQIASTTTNVSGEYYFSSKFALGAGWTGTGADTALLASTAYEIRIDTTNQTRLDTVKLTVANATTNSGNDQNDSDASVTGNYAVIAFTTGAAGSTNHTLDFGFYPCPNITTPSANQTICAGVTGANITVRTNYNTANGIKFVKFTSDQIVGTNPTATELAAIYAGTAISTVTPTGASSPYTATYTWNSADFPNVTSSNIVYYVYAILNPDLGTDCRPVQEIVITVNPTPTTPALATPQNNVCPATTVNLTALSAALTPSVSGGAFEWRVSNSSSSALVGTPTAVGNGIYYLFEKSPSDCYSTAQAVTVTIQICCPTPICIPVAVSRNTGSN